MQIDPFQLNQLENRQLLIAGRAPLLLIAAAVTTNNFEETEPTQETADGKQILLRRVSSNGHLKASATDSRTIKPGNHQIIGIGIAAQETDTELIKQVISAGNELPPLLSAVLPRRCLRCGTAAGIRLSEENCARCNLSVQVGKLFADRDLSDAAWEHLRLLLGLPKALVKLTAAKARALSFLVTNFVKSFSFERQQCLSRQEIAEWMFLLPTIPKAFAGLVRQNAQSAESAEGDPSKISEAAQLNSDSAAPNENNLSIRRKPTTLPQFMEIAARQGSFCYWCGIKVVREAQIPSANRISKNGNTIVYYVGTQLCEEAVGTIDHLVRVIDGGNNNPSNLVISCYPCNQEREKRTLAYNRPFARRRLPCFNCGGRFFHPDWGCCSICGAVPHPLKRYSRWTAGVRRFMKVIRQAGKRLFKQSSTD